MRTSSDERVREVEYFCFRLGEWCFGVPSENVREVFRAGPLTPLPRLPAFVMGVCGHRGEVLPVVDLLRLLGKGEAKVGLRTRLFVGISATLQVAVVTDAVVGLRSIRVSDILPPPSGGDPSLEHLLGLVNPGGEQEALNLLNFPRLIHSARQRVVAR